MKQKTLLIVSATLLVLAFIGGALFYEAKKSEEAARAAKDVGGSIDEIREGESFANPLRAAKICDAIVVNMIDVGEETGDLDKMLLKVADNYDEEVDNAVNGLADNRNWILGMFYVNRDDPSFLVERRFGLGYTINLGNPKAVVLFGLFLAAIIGLAIVGVASN